MLISCPSSGISGDPQKPWFPLVPQLSGHVLVTGCFRLPGLRCERVFPWPEPGRPRFCSRLLPLPSFASLLAHPPPYSRCRWKEQRTSCRGPFLCLRCFPHFSLSLPNTAAHSSCPSGLYSNVTCSVRPSLNTSSNTGHRTCPPQYSPHLSLPEFSPRTCWLILCNLVDILSAVCLLTRMHVSRGQRLLSAFCRFVLVTYFIHSSVYMSVPVFQVIPLTFSTSVSVHLFSTCVSISALQIGSSAPFF